MAERKLILPHYTYQDYLLWEGNWELIDGHPIAMSPSPTPQHQLIAVAIASEIRFALKQENCKDCKVYQPIDYRISEDTVLVPDLLVVCQPITKKYLDFAPALVVEILSPSTAMRDRNTKFSIYESEGVPYYLIVDVQSEKIEIYRSVDGRYQLVPFEENTPFTFTFEEGCSITPAMGDIW